MMQKSYYEIMRERFKRYEELQKVKNKTLEQEEEYSTLVWIISLYCFPIKKPNPFILNPGV